MFYITPSVFFVWVEPATPKGSGLNRQIQFGAMKPEEKEPQFSSKAFPGLMVSWFHR
jgi:hypothetical protein